MIKSIVASVGQVVVSLALSLSLSIIIKSLKMNNKLSIPQNNLDTDRSTIAFAHTKFNCISQNVCVTVCVCRFGACLRFVAIRCKPKLFHFVAVVVVVVPGLRHKPFIKFHFVSFFFVNFLFQFTFFGVHLFLMTFFLLFDIPTHTTHL